MTSFWNKTRGIRPDRKSIKTKAYRRWRVNIAVETSVDLFPSAPVLNPEYDIFIRGNILWEVGGWVLGEG